MATPALDWWSQNGLANAVADPTMPGTNLPMPPGGGFTGGMLQPQNVNVGITDPGQQPPNVQVGGSSSAPAGGPPDGNWQAWFQQLTGGRPLDQDALLALKPQLDAAGVQITPPNAAGDQTKIGLPNGQWVRVLNGDPKQSNPTAWMVQPPGGGGGTSGGGTMGNAFSLYNPNDLTAGFTSSFTAPGGAPVADPFTEKFQAPTLEQARATPGYQFTLENGLQGIDRGAAANGTLLTMGNQKDRAAYATGLADQTYQQIYNNAKGEFGDRFNIHAWNASNAASTYGSAYDRAMQEYMNAFNIFNTNQGNLFNRNYSLAGLGLNAAGGQSGAAQNIGTAGANAATNTGNAQGAGAIATGNANSSIANSAAQAGLGIATNLLSA